MFVNVVPAVGRMVLRARSLGEGKVGGSGRCRSLFEAKMLTRRSDTGSDAARWTGDVKIFARKNEGVQ
jgi:hypothetical protein